jgi:hypothetical protein
MSVRQPFSHPTHPVCIHLSPPQQATGSQRDSRGADEISAKNSREDAIRAAVTAMRVTAMQKELDETGVNSNGVFERLDFIELLVKARLAAAALKDIEDAERLKADANAREEEEEAALERMLVCRYVLKEMMSVFACEASMCEHLYAINSLSCCENLQTLR